MKPTIETDSCTILEIQNTPEIFYWAGLFKPVSNKEVVKCLQNSG